MANELVVVQQAAQQVTSTAVATRPYVPNFTMVGNSVARFGMQLGPYGSWLVRGGLALAAVGSISSIAGASDGSAQLAEAPPPPEPVGPTRPGQIPTEASYAADRSLEAARKAAEKAVAEARSAGKEEDSITIKRGDALVKIADSAAMKEARKAAREALGGNANNTEVLHLLAVTMAKKSEGIEDINRIEVGQKVKKITAEDVKEVVDQLREKGKIAGNRLALAGKDAKLSEIFAPSATPAVATDNSVQKT